MGRRTATFGDLYADFIARHPRKAARTLADMRTRLEELQAGATPRYGSDTIASTKRQVDSYVNGFRIASRCEVCGAELEDPESVARGIGPECWRKAGVATPLPAEPASVDGEAF